MTRSLLKASGATLRTHFRLIYLQIETCKKASILTEGYS